jgi:hypothetical protein
MACLREVVLVQMRKRKADLQQLLLSGGIVTASHTWLICCFVMDGGYTCSGNASGSDDDHCYQHDACTAASLYSGIKNLHEVRT